MDLQTALLNAYLATEDQIKKIERMEALKTAKKSRNERAQAAHQRFLQTRSAKDGRRFLKLQAALA